MRSVRIAYFWLLVVWLFFCVFMMGWTAAKADGLVITYQERVPGPIIPESDTVQTEQLPLIQTEEPVILLPTCEPFTLELAIVPGIVAVFTLCLWSDTGLPSFVGFEMVYS